MVEITAEEQNKGKKQMKTNEYTLRDLWDNLKHTKIQIIGILEEEEKEKGSKKIFEEIIVENFPSMGKEIATQVQKAESQIQVKPKEKHAMTHINQTEKNKHKGKILKAAWEMDQKWKSKKQSHLPLQQKE